jgi:ribosome-associated protein
VLKVNRKLSIPDDELRFVTSRSSGPGGQNVNKVETQAELRFDVAGSPTLSEGQRRRIMSKLSTRITKAGILRVVARKHRSQAANRRRAAERMTELIRGALKRRKPRKKTRPPRSANKRRLEQKRRRGRLKKRRSEKIRRDDW